MKDVGFFTPVEIGEALKLLSDFGEKATVLAGGSDLVPLINYYDLKPENIVYIGKLGLDFIKEDNGKLIIGAATPTAKLAAGEVVAQKARALSQAAGLSGSVSIRNVATIGGNLVNASPAADLASALLALDADLVLAGASGNRTVPIADFFTGPGETVLKPGELLQEIHVPAAKGETLFLKLGRRKALTLSVANASVALTVEDGKCADARIVLGAMAPTPLRCLKAENLIKGRSLDDKIIAECALQAVAESHPIDDQRATAWYRLKVGEALVTRALAQLNGSAN